MTTYQDKAEEMLIKLFREGQSNVESVTVSGATGTFSTPDEFTYTLLTLAHATPAITIPAPTSVGQRKTVYVIQDGTGSRVPSWTGATVNWLTNAAAPVLSTAAAAVDKIDFISTDGTTWDATYVVSSGLGSTFTPAKSTVSLSSGTAAQDATGKWTTWYVQFTGSGTGTAAIAIGPDNTTADAIVPAYEVPATVGSTVPVKLPPNWWIKATITGGVAIVASTVVITEPG